VSTNPKPRCDTPAGRYGPAKTYAIETSAMLVIAQPRVRRLSSRTMTTPMAEMTASAVV
jgi:hypothetical protein